MDFYVFSMYIFWIMNTGTTLLKLIISAKGYRILDRKWRGRSCDETYARLYYIVEGSATIFHHDRKFDLQPGHLYLIPPGSNMRYICRYSLEIIWFHFNISLYGDMDLFQFYSFKFVDKPKDRESVYSEMTELLSLANLDDIFSQLKSKSLLLDLISPFFKFQTSKKSSIDEEKIARFATVLDYIDSHLNKKLTLAELAKLAAYEKTYFSTLFKEMFSVSPKRYILNRRIDKAKSLLFLRSSNIKLETIAYELGFNDAFHFSKTFKKITGENPREFRRKYISGIP